MPKGRVISADVWKAYEANPLTHSAAHYLMTIHALIQRQGYARVTDIARELSITRGSCSISLKPLKRRELVTEDENKFLRLSEEGERLARTVERNDEVLKAFLSGFLEVSDQQAQIDACKIEHLLSLEASNRLARFLQFAGSDSKEAQRFRRAFEAFEPECDGDVDACLMCDEACESEPGSKMKRKGKSPTRS